MAKKSVTVRMKGDHEYESENPQGNVVKIDMYDPDLKKAQSPTELLLSALGGCSSVDAVLMMKKKRKTVQDFYVEVVGTRNEGVPAYFTHIEMKFVLVSPDATNEEFAKVITLAVEKYCSVASSIKSEITYSSEVQRPA
jgi:putative redox protein